ncbi:MAG: hypothetical protein K1W33_07565 [Clostridia bacterium]|nr:hypothetical protein [Clostridia bacterium]
MRNKKEFIDVAPDDENCPADALMANFRKKIKEAKEKDYQKNIEFSNGCVNFFKDMADVVEESDKYIEFNWEDVPNKDLPSLTVKIRKSNGKFYLQYLKEHGEEELVIKGKQRKGKNKNGKIQVRKNYPEKDKEER